MLAQSTGANTANQAALMAGQRGAGANVGLMARQAGQQGGANQQNAAGQAATMQANQSLNALNNMGNLATQQVEQQAGATTGYSQAAQGQQANLLNGIQGQNNSNVSMQSNINNAHAGLANTTMQGQQGMLGGLLGGVGAAPGMAQGGMVRKPMADGGIAMPDGPKSMAGQFLSGGGVQASAAPAQGSANFGSDPGADALKSGISSFGKKKTTAPTMEQQINAPGAGIGTTSQADLGAGSTDAAGPALPAGAMMAAQGGKVPALVSPGERYLSPKAVSEVKSGKKCPAKAGEKIGGKPKVGGSKNSYANDTVPKTLQEGGVVLPRSVTQAKNPAKAAHDFVAALGMRSKK